MGYDDLKTIEGRLFLESVATGKQVAPSVADGWSVAAIVRAAEECAEESRHRRVESIAGPTTFDN
jgi:hypothetical protein